MDLNKIIVTIWILCSALSSATTLHNSLQSELDWNHWRVLLSQTLRKEWGFARDGKVKRSAILHAEGVKSLLRQAETEAYDHQMRPMLASIGTPDDTERGPDDSEERIISNADKMQIMHKRSNVGEKRILKEFSPKEGSGSGDNDVTVDELESGGGVSGDSDTLELTPVSSNHRRLVSQGAQQNRNHTMYEVSINVDNEEVSTPDVTNGIVSDEIPPKSMEFSSVLKTSPSPRVVAISTTNSSRPTSYFEQRVETHATSSSQSVNRQLIEHANQTEHANQIGHAKQIKDFKQIKDVKYIKDAQPITNAKHITDAVPTHDTERSTEWHAVLAPRNVLTQTAKIQQNTTDMSETSQVPKPTKSPDMVETMKTTKSLGIVEIKTIRLPGMVGVSKTAKLPDTPEILKPTESPVFITHSTDSKRLTQSIQTTKPTTSTFNLLTTIQTTGVLSRMKPNEVVRPKSLSEDKDTLMENMNKSVEDTNKLIKDTDKLDKLIKDTNKSIGNKDSNFLEEKMEKDKQNSAIPIEYSGNEISSSSTTNLPNFNGALFVPATIGSEHKKENNLYYEINRLTENKKYKKVKNSKDKMQHINDVNDANDSNIKAVFNGANEANDANDASDGKDAYVYTNMNVIDKFEQFRSSISTSLFSNRLHEMNVKEEDAPVVVDINAAKGINTVACEEESEDAKCAKAVNFQVTLGIFTGVLIGVLTAVSLTLITMYLLRRQRKPKTQILTKQSRVSGDFV